MPSIRNLPEVALAYYGPCGQDVLQDTALAQLSKQIRKRAADKVVEGKGRGPVRFV